MTDRRLLWLAAAVLGAVYLPILAAPFLWDDRSIIVFNAAWDRQIPLVAYFRSEYFTFSQELTWRPLVSLSYEALIGVFGRVPAPWRAAGLALHFLNGVLLGLFLKRAKLPQAACAWAVAMFLVHPVHIETLQVVTFNEETLAAFGLLLMLLAHQARCPLWTAAGLGLALLAKETALMGLPLLVLHDVCFERKRWQAYGPALIVGTAYVWARFVALKGPGGGLSVALPWTERLDYAAQGLVTSALLLAAPVRLRIEYFALPPRSALVSMLWLTALATLLAAAAALARRLWSKDRPLLFFLIWPFVFLSVTSNLLPTGVLTTRFLAERWLYIPFMGACALLAVPLARKPRLATALVVCWGALGMLRARDWANDVKLWSSLVQVYPWSSKAHAGLGEAYFREGRFPEALASFQKAAEVREKRQDLVLAHYVPLAPPGTIAWESASLERWLGLSSLETGNAAARRHLERAQQLQPSDRFTYRALAYACARGGDFAAARRWLEEGLKLDPADDFLLRLKADVAARKLSFQARF